MNFNVAIDGPGGAGKSTVAKELAKRLNCIYVDTGAMYRAAALYFINKNVSLDDELAISSQMDNISIELQFIDGLQKIFLEGVDVSEKIRIQEIGEGASKVAIIPKVREVLVKKQQEIARKNTVVMDGRDIGTNVLKNSKFKFYLDASVEIRTLRRIDELTQRKIACDYDNIKKEIEIRDYRDKNREISPLKIAKNGIYIDTSQMSIDEVTEMLYMIVTRE